MTEINNVSYILNGAPATCELAGSTFTNSYNGINLINCTDFKIKNNTITGYNTHGGGFETNRDGGINLSASSGDITGNTISEFNYGVLVVNSTPVMMRNTIIDNNMYGIWLYGNNTYAYLTDPLVKDIYIDNEMNNLIKNNGINNTEGAQIYMQEPANIYMNQGLNNIYSDGQVNPCIKTSNTYISPTPKIEIKAMLNYWGTDNLGIVASSFKLSSNYKIKYLPILETPLATPGYVKPYGLAPAESDILRAMEEEVNQDLSEAQDIYEDIPVETPYEQETYVTHSRLPDNYVEQGLDPADLINDYDLRLSEEDSLVNKSFYREMKVAVNIKGKHYDEAIALAQNMKNNAESFTDSILADLNIEIATMMKNAQSKGNKNKSESHLAVISNLLDDVRGTDKSEPKDFEEYTTIPNGFILYQNYPNPFNPETQIKFDLIKSGKVKLTIYNVNGQSVYELTNRKMNVGHHSIVFDGSRLNSGIYYYTLELNDNAKDTKIMLLLK